MAGGANRSTAVVEEAEARGNGATPAPANGATSARASGDTPAGVEQGVRHGVGHSAEDGVGTDGDASEGGRPLRADAKRNYERLVAAAKEVFAVHGGGASMEAIAKQAGVGVGTLYRHFPKRIDVVEAVYRTDVDQLVLGAEELVSTLEPWPALVAWLEAFIRYARGKRTFLNELHEAFDKNPELKVSARERINSAMGVVLENAQRAGVVRTDVDGADVMQLVGPMCMNATLSEEQGERLLAMVFDGLRQPAS